MALLSLKFAPGIELFRVAAALRKVPRRAGLLFFLTALLAVPASSQAELAAAGEYEVKAALLLNFAKFVQWPSAAFDGPNTPFHLCVWSSEAADQALRQLTEGKSLEGRPLQVDRLESLDAARGCHMLFVGHADVTAVMRLLHEGFGHGILTVGETEGFAQAGGVINLVLWQDRVSFEINLAAAGRAGLTISSKLLNLAVIVHDNPSAKRN